MRTVLTAALLLSGCVPATTHEQDWRSRMRRLTGKRLDCDAVQILCPDKQCDARGTWAARCGRRSFTCHTVEGRGVFCKETPRSRERTQRRIVRDRLRLETRCERVKLIGATAYTRGTERAYRAMACGTA